MPVGLAVALVTIAMALGGGGDGGNGDQTSPAPEVKEADYEEIFEKVDAMIAYQNKLPHIVNKPNSKAVAQFRGYRESIEEWPPRSSARAASVDEDVVPYQVAHFQHVEDVAHGGGEAAGDHRGALPLHVQTEADEDAGAG